MSGKKPKPRKPSAPRSKPLKLEGTFDELVRKSLQAKKPAGGWPKPAK